MSASTLARRLAAATPRRRFGTSAGDPLRAAFAYCAEELRDKDYENYLWISQLPKAVRAPALAVRAYDLEVSRVASHAAKSEALGGMRYQWWRDAVNACYRGEAPEHPVAVALAAAVAHQPLITRYRLQRILTSRQEAAAPGASRQPGSLSELEGLARSVEGQLARATLEACGIGEVEGGGEAAGGEARTSRGSAGGSSVEGAGRPSRAIQAAEAASDSLGLFLGLSAALRGFRSDLERGQTRLPRDLCASKGVDWEAVRHGRASEALGEVTREVAEAARAHLEAARALRADLPPLARHLMLPAVSADLWLRALERSSFQPLDPALLSNPYSPLSYQLRLRWCLSRGTF